MKQCVSFLFKRNSYRYLFLTCLGLQLIVPASGVEVVGDDMRLKNILYL